MSRPPEISALKARLARSPEERRAAQALRYSVFVEELGGDGPLVDHQARLEIDAFDDHADHLLLFDPHRPEGARVVGSYRLMSAPQAERAGAFYSASEYDLAPLLTSGRRLLELGRSCLHRDYRQGAGLFLMWQALAQEVARQGAEVLFGTASFPGADPARHAAPLSLLHHRHLAPDALRVIARDGQAMDLVPEAEIDRRAAMLAMPPLIRSYLRLGGVVGAGAYVDRAFNTTDICMILDIAAIKPAQRALYQAGPA